MGNVQKPNIKPGYEIASLKDRLLAYFLDWLVIIAAHLIIWPIVLTHVDEDLLLLLAPFSLTVVFYDLLFEIATKGQTPGKKSRNIKVVKLDGTRPRIGHYLLRWITRPLDFVSLGMLAFLRIKGQKGRQLTDLASGTIVVRAEQAIAEPMAKPKAADKPAAPASLIANIAEVSKNARSIYLLFLGLLAYSALTVASTSDRRIILNEPARLPVINLDVPLDGFFILAPVISIFVFVYFQLYLHKLKRLFDDLRTNFRPMAEGREIYPWMLNFATELGSGFVARTQRIIVNFTLWWSLPVVLVLLALWYLKKHDPVLSSVVGIMPLLGTLLVVAFWLHYEQPAGFTFRFNAAQLKAFLKKNKDKPTMLALVLLLEIYLFAVFMPRAIRGERIIGAWPAVDLSDQNLVNKEGERAFWVNLRGARLQGADFTGAILEKADLRQGNLEGAKLEEANLRSADLTGANLRGASLTGAILDSADLRDLKWNLNQLRAVPDTSLSDESVRAMMVEKGFFDRGYNSSANGFPNRFEVQQQGKLIFDRVSGLMWQRSGPRELKTYGEALAYRDNLNQEKFAGFNDWRLPTLEEAMSLMERETNQHGLFIDPIFDAQQSWIWTADKFDASVAWVVSFYGGSCNGNHVDDYYVRAVR